MPNKKPNVSRTFFRETSPYLQEIPVIPGRKLLPDRQEPPFPAFLLVDEKPVTFRSKDAYRTRQEREDYVIEWIERVRNGHPKLVVLMIPNDVYDNPETPFFHAGWTLTEREGEIRTQQCVVFLSGEAVPVGRSDQGVICVASRQSLSAWNGRTHEQSRANAA